MNRPYYRHLQDINENMDILVRHYGIRSRYNRNRYLERPSIYFPFHILDNDSLVDVKVTLTENEFNKLTMFSSEVLSDDSVECAICMDCMKHSKTIVTQLPCKHLFHRDCISSWLLVESTTCPVCRIDIRDHI